MTKELIEALEGLKYPNPNTVQQQCINAAYNECIALVKQHTPQEQPSARIIGGTLVGMSNESKGGES